VKINAGGRTGYLKNTRHAIQHRPCLSLLSPGSMASRVTSYLDEENAFF
jgi:hypothetical protein